MTKRIQAEPEDTAVSTGRALVEVHGHSSVRIYEYWLKKLGADRVPDAVVLGRLSFMDNDQYIAARERVNGGKTLYAGS